MHRTLGAIAERRHQDPDRAIPCSRSSIQATTAGQTPESSQSQLPHSIYATKTAGHTFAFAIRCNGCVVVVVVDDYER